MRKNRYFMHEYPISQKFKLQTYEEPCITFLNLNYGY